MSREKSLFIQVILLAAGIGVWVSVLTDPDFVCHDSLSDLAIFLCAFSCGWGLRAGKGGDAK